MDVVGRLSHVVLCRFVRIPIPRPYLDRPPSDPWFDFDTPYALLGDHLRGVGLAQIYPSICACRRILCARRDRTIFGNDHFWHDDDRCQHGLCPGQTTHDSTLARKPFENLLGIAKDAHRS